MRKAYLIALIVVVAAGTAAYLYLQALVYHPVVHLAVSERLTIIALLPPTKEREACIRANERFTGPFKSCRECKLLAVRCELQLSGMEQAMHEDVPIAHPMVVAKDMRIAVIGPSDAARAGCDLIVA